MRVLHVTAGNLFGGIERMLLTVMASTQAETEHRIAACFDGRLARELRAAGTPPSILGDARFSRPVAMWRARRALKKLIAAFDPAAVIAHAPWSSVLAAPVVRRAGIPLLMWVHDAPAPETFLERRVATAPPDRFICNSRYTAALVSRWLPSIPADVIHPPVPAARPVDAAERRAIRTAEGAGDATTVILLAARMEAWKGHGVLVDAAAALRGDVMVWIAGGAQRPAETRYVEALRTRASAAGGRVRLLGERTDVPRLMAAADVYCQPNTVPEPFGVSLVEALAAGIPAVTPALGGAADIVDDTCGVLLAESSPASVAAALQPLIDDPSRREALGSHGPSQARRLSDPAARLLEIRDVVLEARLRRSAA